MRHGRLDAIERSHYMPEQSPIFRALIDGGRQKLMDKKGFP